MQLAVSFVPAPSPGESGFRSGWLKRVLDVYETDFSPSRIVPMEGLRGWAVLLVFFVHFHGVFSRYLSSNSGLFHVSEFLGTVGGTGVDLFFVISGYLIYSVVIRRKFAYGRFLVRRVQRIYPTFLCVFALYILIGWITHDENFRFHGTFASQTISMVQNVFFLPGIFHIPAFITVAWSLSYEFFFYLVLPILVAVTGMRLWNSSTRAWCVLTVAMISLLVSPLLLPHTHSRIRLVGFLFGIVLFEVADRFRRRPSLLVEATAIGAYACGLGLIFAFHTMESAPGEPLFPLGAGLAGMSAFAFCGFCFHGSGVLRWLFSWRPLRALGNMSYSFYLIHGLAVGMVGRVAARLVSAGHHPVVFAWGLLLAFAAAWAASTLLFTAVEKPLSIQIRRVPARASSLATAMRASAEPGLSST